jgi:hypothetical protein
MLLVSEENLIGKTRASGHFASGGTGDWLSPSPYRASAERRHAGRTRRFRRGCVRTGEILGAVSARAKNHAAGEAKRAHAPRALTVTGQRSTDGSRSAVQSIGPVVGLDRMLRLLWPASSAGPVR